MPDGTVPEKTGDSVFCRNPPSLALVGIFISPYIAAFLLGLLMNGEMPTAVGAIYLGYVLSCVLWVPGVARGSDEGVFGGWLYFSYTGSLSPHLRR